MNKKTMMATCVTAAIVSAAAGCASQGESSIVSMGEVRGERADCPGKIVCPLTGAIICVDECPAGGQH